jgi:integrase
MVDQGIDPLASRDQELAKRAAVEAASITFRRCAEIYLANMKAVHKNAKHHAQWHSTLEKYAFKVIGNMPVQDITVNEITKIIDPLWGRIPETASRLRGRIEKILGWCLVRGHRVGDNPARWTGYLSEVYPKRAQIREIKHHNSLPYQEMPAFLDAIRTDFSAGAVLLRFIIFTMTRTGEARAAMWSEFNLNEKLWIIPGHRMKAGKEHRVPLSQPVMDFLLGAKAINDCLTKPSEFVFPGRKVGTCVSDATAIEFLKRINRTDITPHGMRSCARVWGAECTEFSREILEASLAHKLKDRVEAAYQRSDYLIKRRKVMDAWANFCLGSVQPAQLSR